MPLTITVLAGLSAGLLSGMQAYAAGPQFNIFPVTYVQPSGPSFLDYALIDARKVGGSYSSSQADHDDGVTVNPGDEIDVSIYYHNGTVNLDENVARNTIIKAFSSPGLSTSAMSHVLSASITADNADTVTSDTSRGGNIEIIITGTESQSLTLVPGSVKNLQNWGSRNPSNGSPNISHTVSLPDTVFTSGAAIGDVQGCWPFFGYVNFRLKVSATAEVRGLEITKQVRNVTTSTSFSGSTEAEEGETVEFKVQVKTTGNRSQTDVIVRDTLPSRLEFLSGDDLRGSGKNLGTVSENESRTFIYQTRVIGTSAATLNNTARVKSNEVGEKTASATVVIHLPENEDRDLEITKKVVNVTKGEIIFRDSTDARDGDRVRFEIEVRAIGDADQTRVTVLDTLPSHLTFISGDDLSGSGKNLGTMEPGESETLTFVARVDSSSAITLTNTARVKSDQVSERSDSAIVRVEGESEDLDLDIEKRVRNVTRGETDFRQSTTASSGEIVRFEVEITALGDSIQTGVFARDNLPTGLVFQSGDNLSGSGISIGAMTDGQRRIFSFDARVGATTNSTLTNIAYTQSNQVSQRSDDAVVNVSGTGTTSPTERKTAFNLTQNADATTVTARSGDIITYTLYFRNNGSSTIFGKVIEDNISDVLELAEIVDQGGAISVDHTIRWAPVDVTPGSEVARSFQVRVRAVSLFPATSDLIMVNIYGNEVRVPVTRAQVGGVVITTPPRTGASENLVFLSAGLFTLGHFVYRNRRKFALLKAEAFKKLF